MTLPDETENLEKLRILDAILETGGKKQAARKLGITRQTIHFKLKKWHLEKANAKELIQAQKSVKPLVIVTSN